MAEILKLNTIQQYDDLLGVETLHPLVNAFDFPAIRSSIHGKLNIGFFVVFFKELKCGTLLYGRSRYDYQDGTMLFIAPGQVIGFSDDQGGKPRGWALIFHPDLLLGTSLAEKMKRYTFFRYESNEALHMSDREKQIIMDCFSEIRSELEHPIDKHTKEIVVANIEVMLNHCERFYDRQFITREAVNHTILSRFENILLDYFLSDRPLKVGLPSVQYCASELHLSPNYFGDLIKKETGKTAQEHIQLAVVEQVQHLLLGTDLTISEIAYRLGFKYPYHLNRMFKKITGETPRGYRLQKAI